MPISSDLGRHRVPRFYYQEFNMIIDARTPHMAAVQIANLFEPNHTKIHDLLLVVEKPDLIAIQTSWVQASPLQNFHDACEVVATHPQTFTGVLQHLAHEDNPVRCTL